MADSSKSKAPNYDDIFNLDLVDVFEEELEDENVHATAIAKDCSKSHGVK